MVIKPAIRDLFIKYFYIFDLIWFKSKYIKYQIRLASNLVHIILTPVSFCIFE